MGDAVTVVDRPTQVRVVLPSASSALADLVAHKASTQNVHGIVDAAKLATLDTAQIITGAKTFSPSAVGVVGLVVKALAGQTADLLQVQSSAGGVLARIAASGAIRTDNNMIASAYQGLAGGGYLYFGGGNGQMVAAVASAPAFSVVGAAAQTADLQQWRNSAGGIQAKIAPNGVVTVDEDASGVQTVVGRAVRTGANYLFRVGSGDIAGGAAPESLKIGDSSGYCLFVGSGRVTVAAPSPGLVPLVAKGAVSQTADLQQWQDSAGGILTAVTVSGTISRSGGSFLLAPVSYATHHARFVAQGTGQIPLVAKGIASQTANLQEWQDSTGAALARITNIGHVVTPSVLTDNVLPNAGTTVLFGPSTASVVKLTVRGAASQTANLQEWQSSSGGVLANIKSNGDFDGSTALLSNTSGRLPALEIRHGLGNPQGLATVVVKAAATQTSDLQQWQNSAGDRLLAVEYHGVLRLPQAGGDSFLNWGAGSPNNRLRSAAPSHIPLALMAAAAQTAHLQQWQNSAGTPLASVSTTGRGTFADLAITGPAQDSSAVSSAWTTGKNPAVSGTAETFDFAQMSGDSACVLYVTTMHNSGRNTYVIHASYSANGKGLVVASANAAYGPANAAFALDNATGKIRVTVSFNTSMWVRVENLVGTTTKL